MANAKVSADVTGLRNEDNSISKPLEGKSNAQVFKAHHTKGFKPGDANGCECAHCAEFVATGK